MIRTASQEEIRRVAAPLWTMVNGVRWYDGNSNFDIVKCGITSIVAHLAYCAIDADEREKTIRAKVVPCELYSKLLAGEIIDLTQILAGMDFPNVVVLRTRAFVATVIPAHNIIFVGIRGTQYAYDWLINLRVGKRRAANNLRFHSGFLAEAQRLRLLLQEWLVDTYDGRKTEQKCAIYFSGHSLGGAVAAILYHAGLTLPSTMATNSLSGIDGCYVFGSPRISDSRTLLAVHQPFAIRRRLDIVPHCPPRLLNFGDFLDQRIPNGRKFELADSLEIYFFASWLTSLAMNSFPENHSMERYKREVLNTAMLDKRVAQYWRFGTP